MVELYHRSRAFVLFAAGLAFTAGAILLLSAEAEATHYRGGRLGWTTEPLVTGSTLPVLNPPNTVSLDMELAFRGTFYCFGGCPSGYRISGASIGAIQWGDGTQTTDYDYEITSYDAADDLNVGRVVQAGTTLPVRHTYGGTGTFLVQWGSCCRASFGNGHINNPDTSYNLQADVTPGVTNTSPIATFQPIVDCPGAMCAFVVGAQEPDGDFVTFRLSTAAEALGGPGQWYEPGPCPRCGSPAGSVDLMPNVGQYNWSAAGATPGLYSTQVMVDDGHGSVPVDFFLRIPFVPVAPTCSPATSSVQTGQSVSFTSTGSGNTWSSPAGNPSSGSGSTYATTYSQAGSYDVTVSNGAGSDTCSVTVTDPTPNLHVHAITHSANPNHLFIEVTVQDHNEAGAQQVSVTLETCDSSGSCATLSGLTDAAGLVKVKWQNYPGPGTYTTCVTSLSKAGWHEATDAHANAGKCATATV